MTHLESEQLDIQATSGKKWLLIPVRFISPRVQLVRDATNPSHPHLILKTIDLQSDEHVQLALKDASIWRNICNTDAKNIVLLYDVAVENRRIRYIMQYCSGGNLVSQRTERSALRLIAGATAGLETLILNTSQLAHANLSTEHILLDDDAIPKLSGWSITRALRIAKAKREITERNDVRALCAILFEMIYGYRFDSSLTTLPTSPPVSDETRSLIQEVLFRKTSSISDLTVFRYNIASARKLLPICTPALSPIVDTKREEMLTADLNSQRGLGDQSNISAQPPLAIEPPVRRVRPERNTNGSLMTNEIPDNMNREVEITNERKFVDNSALPTNEDIPSVCSMARRLTGPDLGAIDPSTMNELISVSNQSIDVPQNIFKDVLFKIPISKSPIVAFKTVIFLHHLIAEGPAKYTELILANDRFLGWIETSWSQNGNRKKSKKMQGIPFHADAGEISYYASMLRKRASLHQRFTKVFSTHWVARPAGLPHIQSSLDTLMKDMAELVALCGTLLNILGSPHDVATETKQSAVPILVSELSKVYTAVLWLYATMSAEQKQKFVNHVVAMHVSTKEAIDGIRTNEELATKCAPSALLALEPELPQQLDVNALISSLKKKKKKLKQKKAVTESSSNDLSEKKAKTAENPIIPESQVSGSKPNGRIKDTNIPEAIEQSSSENDDYEEERNLPQQNVNISRLTRTEANGDANGRDYLEENPTEVISLKKLSLSVRNRDSTLNGNTEPRKAMNEYRQAYTSEQWGRSPANGGRPQRSAMGYGISHGGSSQASERALVPRNVNPGTKVKAKKTKPRKNRVYSDSSESDSSSDDDSSPTGVQTEQVRPRDRANGTKRSTVASNSKAKGETKNKKTVARKIHPDEKAIPFDKQPPKRREKKSKEVDESKQGSKEALAAAAKGKKTPNMNPVFEVAPYEVQFGPQIGSGGFGVVYKAKFRTETVAVKKIHQHALSNAASVEEFQSEVAVLCTLRHPNILRFVGACTKPPNLMIITEFMAKGTLFDVLHQSQMRVTWPMRKKFALDTCKGMRYLHNSKLLHRDLKSSNLMLDNNLNCKVGDFGLTRISRGAAAVQMTGQCGTFQYMAVEVLANKPYSEKADVFSFGILLWEMVARKLPYFGMQPMQVGIAVMNQGLRPTIPDKCPPPLAQLMRACWDNEPNKRPSFDQIVTIIESMPE